MSSFSTTLSRSMSSSSTNSSGRLRSACRALLRIHAIAAELATALKPIRARPLPRFRLAATHEVEEYEIQGVPEEGTGGLPAIGCASLWVWASGLRSETLGATPLWEFSGLKLVVHPNSHTISHCRKVEELKPRKLAQIRTLVLLGL